MSEGCIVLHQGSRDEGMRRDSGMGLSKRDGVAELGSHHSLNRSIQNAHESRRAKVLESPRQVTDGSDNSEYTNNGVQNSTNSRDKETSRASTTTMAVAASPSISTDDAMTPVAEASTAKSIPISASRSSSALSSKPAPVNNLLPAKRGLGTLMRSGPTLQDEQSSSSLVASESMPQHEQLEEVEPMDISYVCTTGTLKIKSMLLTRLSDASPGGLLQVVRVTSSLSLLCSTADERL
jgi:hypothetical protein